MTDPLTIRRRVRFRAGRGQAVESKTASTGSPGRIPRVTRLMALAIRLEGLIAVGEVPN